MKKRELIREVSRGGKRLRAGALSATFMRSGDDTFKLCVIVPKNCGNAVKRNRMKRAIRETCRREYQKTEIPGLVIFTYRGIIGVEDYAKATGKTERLFKEIAEKCS